MGMLFTSTRRAYLAILLTLITMDGFVQPCIMLLNGWTKMSVGKRAQLAKVVFVGKVASVYPVDAGSQTYAADFEIYRILKGKAIVDEVFQMYSGPTVKVYGFGEKRLCYSEVFEGEMHLVFTVYHPKSRSLVARYDDIFGAISRASEENEDEVLTALGWRAWSPWSPCTHSCSGGSQWRTRQCNKKPCEGNNRERRRCNFFKCYGIKNVGQYFSPSHPNRVSSAVRSGRARHVWLRGPKPLSLQTPQVFQYYFPEEYSVALTFRAVKYSDVYLLVLYDYAHKLQFGLRIAHDMVTLELEKNTDYTHREWSMDFDVFVSLDKWHSVTLSLKARQVTLYWDCEKAGTKSLPGRFSFAPDPMGSITLGKSYAKGHNKHLKQDKQIEIRELYFIPDVHAARQQCQGFKVSSSSIQYSSSVGSGVGMSDGEGSGSNYVDDPNQVEMEWSSWSPCSRTCDKGVRRRVMMCVNLDDKPPSKECLKALQTSEQKACNLKNCPARCYEPCLNGGYCASRNTCKCKSGYHGNRCEKVTCRLKCYNGGKCVGPESCHCPQGYTGRQCKIPVCKTRCLNGGRCVRPGICQCPPGYRQPNCKASCSPACSNGGKCVGPDTCLCSRGYHGSHCHKPTCRRSCQNGGRCYAPDKCSCPYGWYGVTCHKARCHPKCHKNGGRCVRPNLCLCPRGTYGFFCQYGSRY